MPRRVADVHADEDAGEHPAGDAEAALPDLDDVAELPSKRSQSVITWYSRAPMTPATTPHTAIALASSRVPMWRSSSRRPNSQHGGDDAEGDHQAVGVERQRADLQRPDDGLGMLASTAVMSGPGDLPGERRRLDVDHVAVEVLRRHVVAALEPAVVDVAAVVRGEVLALGSARRRGPGAT